MKNYKKNKFSKIIQIVFYFYFCIYFLILDIQENLVSQTWFDPETIGTRDQNSYNIFLEYFLSLGIACNCY